MGWNGSFIFVLSILIVSVLGHCTTNSDCEHNGECHNNKCQCELTRYAGDHCQYLMENYLGIKYDVYFYFILFISLLLWVLWSLKTYTMHREAKKFTVLHLACWFGAIGMFLRALSYLIVVDRQWTRDDHVEPLSGLMFYLFYPLFLSAYLCQAFIWLELYTATTQIEIENLPRYRKIFIVINGVMFPLEFIVRTLNKVYYDTIIAYTMTTVYFVYVAFAAFLEAGSLIVIIALVLRRLKNMQAVTGKEASKKSFQKISKLFIGVSVLLVFTLIVLSLFLVTTTTEGLLVILWLARAAEYSFCGLLLFMVRPPHSRTAHSVDSFHSL
mmetsp:Transcript_18994/g.26567  ORF Transcript_18994/g.26567 Transcript_18994/m.26567 type:complete len:327 (+) Transcript_18994:131-1111(+)